jgi:predicted MFS family arabinose efflux permease
MSAVREAVGRLRAGHGWTLLVVASGWLLVQGFRVALPAILPQIKTEFAVGNTGAGFALTVLWFAYAAMQFPSGVVADRIGERRLLVGGIALATLCLGLFYLAPLFAVFLLACGAFGVGAGLYGTPRDMLLSRTFPRTVSTAYTVTFSAGSIGAAALPLVVTALATRFDWRIAVLALLPLFAVVGLGLWRVVPAAPTTDDDGLSARETAVRTARALSDRTVLLASAGMVLFIFTYQAILSFLPTYLVEVKGLDSGTAAALFGLLFVFAAVVQPITGTLADRYGERPTVIVLVVLSTVTLLALPFTDARLALAVLVPVLGIRIAIGPLTSAYVVPLLPEDVQGSGWGLLRTVFFGVGSTGSTVVGVFGDAGLFDAAFLFLTALTGVIVVFWLLLPSRGGGEGEKTGD